MYGDCGANKEAVTLLIISAFAGFAQKSTGDVAGLPQTPPAKNFRLPYGLFFAPAAPVGSLK
jgi:hypothetical protein